METVYDVIIAGGGIAGSYAARELAKAQLKVLIIDQISTLGSTAGTPVITIEKFQLPKEGINSDFNSVILGTLNNERRWRSDQNIGYILDYKRMISLLLEEAKKFGCIIYTESAVRSLIFKNEEIVGVNTSKGDFHGKYFIDATGSAGVLISEIGMRKRVPCPPSVGIEHEVYDGNKYFIKYKDSISVYFDTNLFGCGYGWVFSNGIDKYKIGICEYMDYSKNKLSNIESRLESFTKYLLGNNKIEIIEKHGGSIFVGPKFKVNNIRYKNILGIGDTIGTINPLLGEGIRHALYSSSFAVKAILGNIRNNEDLNSYEKGWKEYIGNRWAWTAFVGLALYEKNTKITQQFYIHLLKFMQFINLDELLKIIKDYDLKIILKKFPKNVVLFLSLLRTRFLNFN